MVPAVTPRATSLSPQDFLLLDQWGRQLLEAFRDTPYLVGSVLAGGVFRDVDVRILSNEQWVVDSVVRLRALNLSVTLWGRQVTGLPIDFQFQADAEFRAYDGSPRNPFGLRSSLEAEA